MNKVEKNGQQEARFEPPSYAISFGNLFLREAEAAVGAEVELRLAAACSNRGLWPRPIREEVERLEQRLGGLQVGSRWLGYLSDGWGSRTAHALKLKMASHIQFDLTCLWSPPRSRALLQLRASSRPVPTSTALTWRPRRSSLSESQRSRPGRPTRRRTSWDSGQR